MSARVSVIQQPGSILALSAIRFFHWEIAGNASAQRGSKACSGRVATAEASAIKRYTEVWSPVEVPKRVPGDYRCSPAPVGLFGKKLVNPRKHIRQIGASQAGARLYADRRERRFRQVERLSGQSRSPEFLGHLVRPVPDRDSLVHGV